MAIRNGTNGNDVLNGTDNDDDLFGFIGKDILIGGAGNDRLFGGSEVDRLEGGAGNDILDGGTGNDVMIGGTGDDTYYVDGFFDTVEEKYGEGYDTVYTSIEFQTASSVEAFIGVGSANILLRGNGLDNLIIGNSGNNEINGGGGSDVIDGGAGQDVLMGDFGIDTFVFHKGEAAGDTIVDFEGYGRASGESIRFVGYSEGATFERVSGNTYQIVDGDLVETLTIRGQYPVHPSDYTFV